MSCVAKVWRDWHRGRCSRAGKVTRFGVKVCAQHARQVDEWRKRLEDQGAMEMMIFHWSLRRKGGSRMSKGDCYQAAARFVLDNEGWTLVHGSAVGQGPIKGVVHGHAWAEREGVVVDTSNGKTLHVGRELFYAIGNVHDVTRYSREETRSKLLRYEHYGPWEKEV